MRTYCAPLLGVVLLAGFVAVNARGQTAEAQAHVAAAKAAVSHERGCEALG